MEKIEGVFAVLPTPFTKDENINYEGLKKNIEWNIENGIHGILGLGSTGEFTTMSEEEKRKVAEFIVNSVDGRVPVFLGTNSDSTTIAIKNAKHAEKIGADGVLIIPPYYFNPLQEEIIEHFRLINNEINIPIMIYNNPGVSGVDIQLKTVLTLAEEDNIKYIKESTGDITRLREIARNQEDKISAFCGCDELALESFFLEAGGWISVVSNAFPKLSSDLFEAVVNDDDYKKAKEIYNKLLPFCIELESSGKLVQVIKYIMDKRGMYGGYSRSPKLPLTEEHKKRINLMLKKIDIL